MADGELEAEDAGSPVDARLLTSQSHIDRLALGADAGHSYDESIPMEVFVERERVPWTHALRVQAGQMFLRLHSPALRTKYAAKYLAQFRFPQNAEADFGTDTGGLNLYVATRRRDMDGEQLVAAITGGTLITAVGIDVPDRPAITTAADRLMAWLARQYSQPEVGAAGAWNPERLTYAFRAAAPGASGEQRVLDASRYPGGRLGLVLVRGEPRSPKCPRGLEADHLTPAAEREAISFIPTQAHLQRRAEPTVLGDGGAPGQLRLAECFDDRPPAAGLRGDGPGVRQRLVCLIPTRCR